MTDLWLFAATAILAAGLAACAIRGHQSLVVRAGSLAVLAVFCFVAYTATVELLARPKATTLEWVRRATPEAEVVAFYLAPDEAIYLWLMLPGVLEPRAYVLPWHEERARELYQAMQDGSGNVRVRRPFERAQRQENMFYAQPQPAPPPKETPAEPQWFGR